MTPLSSTGSDKLIPFVISNNNSSSPSSANAAVAAANTLSASSPTPMTLRQSTPGMIGKAKLNTIKITLTLVGVFLACWTPYYVICLWYGHAPEHETLSFQILQKSAREKLLSKMLNILYQFSLSGAYTPNLFNDLDFYLGQIKIQL